MLPPKRWDRIKEGIRQRIRKEKWEESRRKHKEWEQRMGILLGQLKEGDKRLDEQLQELKKSMEKP